MRASRAPAKVNLTLHILGRREDGYHELESLVAFAGASDLLSLEPGRHLGLTVTGPRAGATGPLAQNLVIRAATELAGRLPELRLGAFHLIKRLPAAAGIGGGSSDAAAALRLLAAEAGIGIDHPAVVEAARRTGADVPVCLDPRMRMMKGVGEIVGPALGLPPLFAVLVNPGVAVPTADVFRALGLRPGAPRATGARPHFADGAPVADLVRRIGEGANDLEAPALAIAPVIGRALDRLRQAGCQLARMSGSGATVFGLFADCRATATAARALRAEEPGWWVRPTVLR